MKICFICYIALAFLSVTSSQTSVAATLSNPYCANQPILADLRRLENSITDWQSIEQDIQFEFTKNEIRLKSHIVRAENIGRRQMESCSDNACMRKVARQTSQELKRLSDELQLLHNKRQTSRLLLNTCLRRSYLLMAVDGLWRAAQVSEDLTISPYEVEYSDATSLGVFYFSLFRKNFIAQEVRLWGAVNRQSRLVIKSSASKTFVRKFQPSRRNADFSVRSFKKLITGPIVGTTFWNRFSTLGFYYQRNEILN